jgi:hypothetical protein
LKYKDIVTWGVGWLLDLEGVRDHQRVLCEVKTINVSDDEISARRVSPAVRKVESQLDDGCFDDWGGFYEEDYLRQIAQHLSEQPPAIDVVVKPDLSKAEARIVAQQ